MNCIMLPRGLGPTNRGQQRPGPKPQADTSKLLQKRNIEELVRNNNADPIYSRKPTSVVKAIDIAGAWWSITRAGEIECSPVDNGKNSERGYPKQFCRDFANGPSANKTCDRKNCQYLHFIKAPAVSGCHNGSGSVTDKQWGDVLLSHKGEKPPKKDGRNNKATPGDNPFREGEKQDEQ